MDDPKLFEDDIDPNDIKQGQLGDCWFLSALSSLAERKGLVKRLFITQEYNEEGIYKIKMFKNGEIVIVTIDDYIPCRFNGGPLFSRGAGNELWVLLIEKAYAKLHGNYYALSSGYTTHAMVDLTGCPCVHIAFPPEGSSYEDVEEEADEIFERILEADEQGYLISTETSGKDTITEGDGPGKGAGLVSGHAYSIIQVKEGNGVKLLNIRNPWGQFEWNGDWSDHSDLWTDEMIDEFQPVLEDNDGSFWMCLEDFIEKFRAINYCKIENFNEVRLKGKFIKGSTKDGSDSVLSKFYYTFNLEEETVMNISLHQEDERIVGVHLRKNMDAGFVVLKNEGDEDEPDFVFIDYCPLARERDITKEFSLEEGSYAVVPLTTGALLQRTLKASKTPVNYKYIHEHYEERPHPYFLSTINDIFRKTDLQVNGRLSARELNQLGKIIDSDYFKNIKDSDFTSSEFADISCDKEGVSLLGFKQLLFRKFQLQEIRDIMTKLGYDEALNSTKSRIFMMNFQANEDVGELEVSVNESITKNMHNLAWNKLHQHLIEEEGLGDLSTSKGNYDLFGYVHKQAYAVTFALVNKTEEDLKVKLDLTSSSNCLFSPTK